MCSGALPNNPSTAMPSAVRLSTANQEPSASPVRAGLGEPGAKRKVARDFAVLLGAALTIGVTVAVGMVLAVLILV